MDPVWNRGDVPALRARQEEELRADAGVAERSRALQASGLETGKVPEPRRGSDRHGDIDVEARFVDKAQRGSVVLRIGPGQFCGLLGEGLPLRCLSEPRGLDDFRVVIAAARAAEAVGGDGHLAGVGLKLCIARPLGMCMGGTTSRFDVLEGFPSRSLMPST